MALRVRHLAQPAAHSLARKSRFSGNSAVSVRRADALYLSHIESASIDLIVTDPPWGFWDGDVYAGANSISSLYTKMLEEFYRVLSGRGRAIVLTGAKKEFEEAVSQSKGFVHCTQAKGYRTDILVNGKKSAIFCLMR